MIKGKPCKVADYSTSKTGKHGHAKAHIVAGDISTSKKYEDLQSTAHNIVVPIVKKVELQVLSAELDSGEISLLMESGETKDDLCLPHLDTKCGTSTEDQVKEDLKCSKEICEAIEEGEKTVMAIVQGAYEMEKSLVSR